MSTWAELKAREERAREKCGIAVGLHFPRDKYEILEVMPIPGDGSDKCEVDFKRKQYQPEIDCDEYCEGAAEPGEEEYNQCVEDCEDTLRTSIIGRVAFDADTLSIEEGTIPGSCEHVWMSEGEDPEEWEKERKKLDRKFEKTGCQLGEAWIHPHELVGGVEWEEYPAVCYAHLVSTKERECKVPDVMPLIEREFSPPSKHRARETRIVV